MAKEFAYHVNRHMPVPQEYHGPRFDIMNPRADAVRPKIWKYLLQSNKDITPYFNKASQKGFFLGPQTSYLLRLNKKSSAETIAIFYGENTFQFKPEVQKDYSAFLDFMRGLGSSQLRALRSIHLVIDPQSYRQTTDYYVAAALAYFVGNHSTKTPTRANRPAARLEQLKISIVGDFIFTKDDYVVIWPGVSKSPEDAFGPDRKLKHITKKSHHGRSRVVINTLPLERGPDVRGYNKINGLKDGLDSAVYCPCAEFKVEVLSRAVLRAQQKLTCAALSLITGYKRLVVEGRLDPPLHEVIHRAMASKSVEDVVRNDHHIARPYGAPFCLDDMHRINWPPIRYQVDPSGELKFTDAKAPDPEKKRVVMGFRGDVGIVASDDEDEDGDDGGDDEDFSLGSVGLGGGFVGGGGSRRDDNVDDDDHPGGGHGGNVLTPELRALMEASKKRKQQPGQGEDEIPEPPPERQPRTPRQNHPNDPARQQDDSGYSADDDDDDSTPGREPVTHGPRSPRKPTPSEAPPPSSPGRLPKRETDEEQAHGTYKSVSPQGLPGRQWVPRKTSIVVAAGVESEGPSDTEERPRERSIVIEADIGNDRSPTDSTLHVSVQNASLMAVVESSPHAPGPSSRSPRQAAAQDRAATVPLVRGPGASRDRATTVPRTRDDARAAAQLSGELRRSTTPAEQPAGKASSPRQGQPAEAIHYAGSSDDEEHNTPARTVHYIGSSDDERDDTPARVVHYIGSSDDEQQSTPTDEVAASWPIQSREVPQYISSGEDEQPDNTNGRVPTRAGRPRTGQPRTGRPRAGRPRAGSSSRVPLFIGSDGDDNSTNTVRTPTKKVVRPTPDVRPGQSPTSPQYISDSDGDDDNNGGANKRSTRERSWPSRVARFITGGEATQDDDNTNAARQTSTQSWPSKVAQYITGGDEAQNDTTAAATGDGDDDDDVGDEIQVVRVSKRKFSETLGTIARADNDESNSDDLLTLIAIPKKRRRRRRGT